MKLEGLKREVTVMTTLEGAKRFASKCIKAYEVVLGDNCQFWIVCFADAQRLVKMGYEIAK